MPKPYPQEFRDDVLRVARGRPDGVTLDAIANDFGIHAMTLSKWLRQAAIEDVALKPTIYTQTMEPDRSWKTQGSSIVIPLRSTSWPDGFRATHVQLAADNSAIQRTTTFRQYPL